MTSDRELLELAAKAQGIELKYDKLGQLIDYYWNPLVYDGDALRLAVKLKMTIVRLSVSVSAADYDGKVIANEILYKDADHYAATRRAITRAAAEIGKEMKP